MASPKQWYNMKLLLVCPSGRTCSGEPLAARPWWRWKSTLMVRWFSGSIFLISQLNLNGFWSSKHHCKAESEPRGVVFLLG